MAINYKLSFESLKQGFEEVKLSIDINDMLCVLYKPVDVNIKMCVIRQITVFELLTSLFLVKSIHTISSTDIKQLS